LRDSPSQPSRILAVTGSRHAPVIAR
jgi:hypothetical protein